jgi:hypothetical protein
MRQQFISNTVNKSLRIRRKMSDFNDMKMFGIDFFGLKESKKLSNKKLKSFYEDWKRSGYSIEQYKRLVKPK